MTRRRQEHRFNNRTHIFEHTPMILRDEPIEIILTVEHVQDPARFGQQPPNVHIDRFVPQSAVPALRCGGDTRRIGNHDRRDSAGLAAGRHAVLRR